MMMRLYRLRNYYKKPKKMQPGSPPCVSTPINHTQANTPKPVINEEHLNHGCYDSFKQRVKYLYNRFSLYFYSPSTKKEKQDVELKELRTTNRSEKRI